MATGQPESDEVPSFERNHDKWVTQERHYRVITPLFGGGVEEKTNDEITPIRGTEVRGQLRFWWRTLRGGKYANVREMKAAEDALWGTTSAPGKPGESQVDVVVFDVERGEEDEPFVLKKSRQGNLYAAPRRGSVVPAYVAFPLQPERKEIRQGMKMATVKVGVTFKLKLRFPEEFRLDVEAALWAWETFGGVGARTRRGFGAIACTKAREEERVLDPGLPPSYDSRVVTQFLKERIAQYSLGTTWPPNVPHLLPTSQLKVAGSSADSLDSWQYLIDKLKDFRQNRSWVSGGGRGHPGRSNWPEPDEIRRRTKKGAHKYTSAPKYSISKFPRAHFGLPIIFEFNAGDERNSPAAPPKTSLQGIPDPSGDPKYERLASPLILRPLTCANGQYVGLGLILETPREPPQGVELVEQGSGKTYPPPIDATLTAPEARAVTPLSGDIDILRAFLKTL